MSNSPKMMPVEKITPQDAERMLATMVKNRPVSDSKVLEYALSIDDGRWSVNGETIKINKDGQLFDGQHRLRACILAGKPFMSYVARGVDDEHAFATVDVGKTRSHGDIFGIAGFSNSNLVSSIAILVYAHEKRLLNWSGLTGLGRQSKANTSPAIISKIKRMPQRSSTITKEDLLSFSESISEGLATAARFAERWKAIRLLPRPLTGGVYYLFRQRSLEDAERFFTDIAEGVGLTKTDPVYHLRERLIENSGNQAKLNRFTIVGLMFKAWNKRRAGEPVRQLRISDAEEFPRKLI